MTYGELADFIYTQVEEKNQEMKFNIMNMYIQAQLFGIAFNEPKKFPKIYDVYPNLFENKHVAIKMPSKLKEYKKRRW